MIKIVANILPLMIADLETVTYYLFLTQLSPAVCPSDMPIT